VTLLRGSLRREDSLQVPGPTMPSPLHIAAIALRRHARQEQIHSDAPGPRNRGRARGDRRAGPHAGARHALREYEIKG
jgi:hypothetical protein